MYFGSSANYLIKINNVPKNIIKNGDKDSSIISYFKENIVAEMIRRKSFKTVIANENPIDINYLRDSITNDSKNTLLLKDKLNNCTADLVLFVFDVIIDTSFTNSYWQDVSVTVTSLNFNYKFIFWNNKSKQIISYGNLISESANGYEGLNSRNWKNIIKTIVADLLRKLNNPKQG
jgi:hypothetical protein